MICQTCGEFKPLERNGNCGTCNHLARKSGRVKTADNSHSNINTHSEKGAKVERRYLNRLRTWKRGKKCSATFSHECSNVIETHHMGGRSNDSYWDEWAEENDVVLTLDERLWMPLCPEAHRYVTKNSKWACENGYSFLRVTDKVFRKEVSRTAKSE